MTDPTISAVHARRIWDSRGRPTVEVDVTLSDGSTGRGIAPAGASRGSREAIDKRDGGPRLGGFDVQNALANIRDEIAPALLGRDPLDQAGIDAAIIALDGTEQKSRLGGNAIVATSLAVLHSAAASRRQPLWAIWPKDGR
jgi:enolase